MCFTNVTPAIVDSFINSFISLLVAITKVYVDSKLNSPIGLILREFVRTIRSRRRIREKKQQRLLSSRAPSFPAHPLSTSRDAERIDLDSDCGAYTRAGAYGRREESHSVAWNEKFEFPAAAGGWVDSWAGVGGGGYAPRGFSPRNRRETSLRPPLSHRRRHVGSASRLRAL